MYGKLNAMRGLTTVRVSGNMTQNFLNCCASGGLELYNVRREDDFTLSLAVNSQETEAAAAIAVKSCCEMEVLSRRGGGDYFRTLRLRIFPVLLALSFVALLFCSKFYVWEIRVSGCETVSQARVLDALARCGVKSGAFWPDFSSDSIRSEVLSLIPELSWISVNMHGALAEAVVVERKEPPELLYGGEGAHIIAGCSGFVSKVDVLSGAAAVKRGDAVRAGDVLISGVMESSVSPPNFVRALGGVSAEINSEISALTPKNEQAREYTGRVKRKYALIIGNYRINFYSGSSISNSFCDKIISVWKAKADGLFSLPLSLVCEKEYYYGLSSRTVDDSLATAKIEDALSRAFERSWPDAEILSEKLIFGGHGELCTGTLRTRCICDIGISSAISPQERAEAEAKFEKADDK